MHDSDRILENRITRELIERILPAETLARVPLDVSALTLDGEPVPVADIEGSPFEPIDAGTPWGRPWGTTWFHVNGPSPQAGGCERRLTEVVAELGFTGGMAGFQAEGAVYVDGRIRCGVHPMRRAIPLDVAGGAGGIDFLIEAAANPDFTTSFTANPMGSLATAGDRPLYTFGGVWLQTVDLEVRRLIADIGLLNEAMRVLPRGHRRRKRLATTFQLAYDALDPADVPGTAPGARAILAQGLDWPAAHNSHRVSAIGHAHIDTAWLWPLRETRRKCARTFSNQIDLMDRYPEHRFACSQAVQYSWIEQDHPELFDSIRSHVASGQWLPVGGMWVEADMNLPSGESLVRQMVHGQRYFESRFGMRCDEVWIPDVFGYPGNLPQVFRSGGATRFVTQKLSWNKANRFPHHTFVWEGIDGSEVLAHFPPVDTYNAEVNPRELTHVVANFRDHAWSDHSLMPFGHGDGGGGPTREMLERARVLSDLAELPRVTIEGPARFFESVESEVQRSGAPRWMGELYFEMHRGTFTSQAATKVGNRRCEDALRDAEVWLASLGDNSASGELDSMWKTVLTHQFHDIIPGSSIAWVHEDAERDHATVLERARQLSSEALGRLSGGAACIANSASTSRTEVVRSTTPPPGGAPVQELADGSLAFAASAPALGLAPARAVDPGDQVVASAGRLVNGALEVRFDEAGNVTSVFDRMRGREVLPPGTTAGRLTVAPDTPVEYDAWDVEQWTAGRAQPLGPATEVTVLESGPLVGTVRVIREFGDSRVAQDFTLTAGSGRLDVHVDVDWQESEQLLAIDFPLDVRTDHAACEVQFGHEYRPTHRNTSWDDAKFEVCAQRWVDLSEQSFGVAVLNNGRHGHALQDGGVRVSLLRAPLYPDPTADRGHHVTTLALLPHGPGLAEVVAEAEALNRPLRFFDGPGDGSPDVEPVVSVAGEGVQVSAVKLADDGSGDLVVRLWSAAGDRVDCRLGCATPISGAVACNALEEPLGAGQGPPVVVHGGAAAFSLGAHEFATLRLQR